MKYYLFSLVIGIVISITFNYFNFFKSNKIIIPLLLDIILISVITFIIIKTSLFIDNRNTLLLLFISLFLYLIYIFKIRSNIYLFYMIKERDKTIEILYEKKFKNKITIYKCEEYNQISILPNNKDVVIGSEFVDEISDEDICNVIAVNYTNNKLLDILFLLIYFLPAIVFYYASTQETGNTKTFLILFASFLIFLIGRVLPKIIKINNIKALKGIVNKHSIISSVEKYYSRVIENSSKNKTVAYTLEKNETIERLNKI